MNLKQLIIITTMFSIVVIAVGVYEKIQQTATIHQIIGEYGVQMKNARGEDITGLSATWYIGYEPFETRIIQTANSGTLLLGIGLLLGNVTAYLIYKQTSQKIKMLEEQVKAI